MKYFIIILLISTLSSLIQITQCDFQNFVLSPQCINDISYCTEEEQEYKAIAELHSQMDDDKNGDIDIYESKDFVQGSLATPHGSEKAKRFHKNDSHINKQDLWNIWKSSDVFNWTTSDMVYWMNYDVELPQYTEILNKLNLNGSFMPRFTELAYLTNTLQVADAIHKRKIMIKAVDAVLFGSNQKYQISKWSIGITLLLFVSVIAYLGIQNMYSKRYMRNMESRLEQLSVAEDNLCDLRNKLEEVEVIKSKKDFEIEELNQKHIREIQKVKNNSTDSLNEDSQRLREARMEILRLNQALDEAQIRIQNLSKRKYSNKGDLVESHDPFLLGLLQWTRSMEDHYIKEKENVIDQESAKFRGWAEKLRKRKSGILGVISLAHSSEMDEMEKQVMAMKRAYEKLIQEKQDHKWRWKKIEELTGLIMGKLPDSHTIKQTVMSLADTYTNQKRQDYRNQRYKSHPDNVGMSLGVNKGRMFSIDDLSNTEDNKNTDYGSLEGGDDDEEKTSEFESPKPHYQQYQQPYHKQQTFSSDSQNSSKPSTNETKLINKSLDNLDLSSSSNSSITFVTPTPPPTTKETSSNSKSDRSRKSNIEKKRPFFRSARTRIPSLTRLNDT